MFDSWLFVYYGNSSQCREMGRHHACTVCIVQTCCSEELMVVEEKEKEEKEKEETRDKNKIES
jgi:hypothetical protein